MRRLRFLNSFILYISILAILTGCAANKSSRLASNPDDIAINWQLIHNNHAGGGQFLSALRILNKDSLALDKKGWKLYFNFARTILTDSVKGNVKIVHVNGDLYYLTPDSTSFKALNKGTSAEVRFVAKDWAINFTDAPEGFYIVYDNDPDNPLALKDTKTTPSTSPEQFARTPDDHIYAITPAMVYEQNKDITDIPVAQLPKIFPTPLHYEALAGEFILDQSVKIDAEEAFKAEANFLREKLDRIFKPGKAAGQQAKVISLKLNKALEDEGYELSINGQQIQITASGPAGIFYGIQSLLNSLTLPPYGQQADALKIANAKVSDAPRFHFRGLMIDVGRNFQTKEEIFKVLELMAMYKLNKLHFHLNEDEGWRLEIAGLPELTEVGSVRGHIQDKNTITHLPPSFGSGPDVNNPYGSGYYTKQDFIDILTYAKQRHIQVIPEIEAPGHARAAVISMRARYDKLMKAGKETEAKQYLLSDLHDRSKYSSVQNWQDNVMDPSIPSTYNFISKITDELISLYKAADAPLQTIHFGGDEVPQGAWEGSPNCQDFIRKHPELKDINGLWAYFYSRINDILKSKKLYLSGWEEAGMKPELQDGKRTYVINPGLAGQNIHLNVWNNIIGWGNEDLAYRLANGGYKVILSGVSNLYFDMAYQKSFNEPGYYWGEFVDLDKPFKFIPFNAFLNADKDKLGNTLATTFYDKKVRLTAEGKANIVGIQGLLWSETIKGPEKLEYMLMPKLLGLAERAWAPDPAWAQEQQTAKRKALYTKAWSEFVNVTGKKELPRINASFESLNYRIPSVGAVAGAGTITLNTQLPGLTIRYTTDGTTPTVKSTEYRQPISSSGVVKFRAFDNKGRAGRVDSITISGTPVRK